MPNRILATLTYPSTISRIVQPEAPDIRSAPPTFSSNFSSVANQVRQLRSQAQTLPGPSAPPDTLLHGYTANPVPSVLATSLQPAQTATPSAPQLLMPPVHTPGVLSPTTMPTSVDLAMSAPAQDTPDGILAVKVRSPSAWECQFEWLGKSCVNHGGGRVADQLERWGREAINMIETIPEIYQVEQLLRENMLAYAAMQATATPRDFYQLDQTLTLVASQLTAPSSQLVATRKMFEGNHNAINYKIFNTNQALKEEYGKAKQQYEWAQCDNIASAFGKLQTENSERKKAMHSYQEEVKAWEHETAQMAKESHRATIRAEAANSLTFHNFIQANHAEKHALITTAVYAQQITPVSLSTGGQALANLDESYRVPTIQDAVESTNIAARIASGPIVQIATIGVSQGQTAVIVQRQTMEKDFLGQSVLPKEMGAYKGERSDTVSFTFDEIHDGVRVQKGEHTVSRLVGLEHTVVEKYAPQTLQSYLLCTPGSGLFTGHLDTANPSLLSLNTRSSTLTPFGAEHATPNALTGLTPSAPLTADTGGSSYITSQDITRTRQLFNTLSTPQPPQQIVDATASSVAHFPTIAPLQDQITLHTPPVRISAATSEIASSISLRTDSLSVRHTAIDMRHDAHTASTKQVPAPIRYVSRQNWLQEQRLHMGLNFTRREIAIDEATLHNLQCAHDAIWIAKELLPFGSGDQRIEMYGTKGESWARVKLLERRYIRIASNDSAGQAEQIARIIKMGAGNCGEFSAIVFMALANMQLSAPISRVTCIDQDHSFCIIGDPNSDTAVMVDAWSIAPAAHLLRDSQWKMKDILWQHAPNKPFPMTIEAARELPVMSSDEVMKRILAKRSTEWESYLDLAENDPLAPTLFHHIVSTKYPGTVYLTGSGEAEFNTMPESYTRKQQNVLDEFHLYD